MKHYTTRKTEIEVRESWDTSYLMTDVYARSLFEEEVRKHGQRVAEQLRVARNGSGFSQSELASIIGVTQQAICKWETARCEPSYEEKLAISKVTNYPIQRLL